MVSHGVLRDGIHSQTLGDRAIDKHADTSMNGGDGKFASCGACSVCLLRRYNRDSGATVVQLSRVFFVWGLDKVLPAASPIVSAGHLNPSGRFQSRRCG